MSRLRLALVSDLHLGAGREHHHDNWLKIVSWIAREKPDLVVANGDLIMGNPDDEADYAFARGEIARLPVPCRYLPGNHDVGDNVLFGDQAERVNEERRARFVRYFGEERWSFEAAGWGFVGVNAQLFGSGGQAAEAKQWQWLQAALASHAGKPVALFTHKPLFLDHPGEPNHAEPGVYQASLDSESRARLMAMMKRHHVRLVVSGHKHQTRSFSLDGTYYLWAPSTACVNGAPHCRVSGVVALGCALLVSVARAQIADRVRETNGIIFVSGGIGADSREQLAAREKSYNYKLITTLEGSGKFVTAAHVTLTSATGAKLVEHVTEGPILLMGLPAGAYVISATFRGITRTRKIQVRSERLLTEYMRWPADAEDGVLPPEPK